MSLLIQILVGLVAVALGIFLGMPGKQPDEEADGAGGRRIGAHGEKKVRELENALGRAARRSKGAKRYFTPLDLLRRDRRASERRRTRRHFKTVAPSRRKR